MTKDIQVFWLTVDTEIKQQEIAFTFHSRPHSTEWLHLKSTESYKSIWKEIKTF